MSDDQYVVDRLFRVTGKVDVTLRGVTRTYYLRTITGAGDEGRRKYALEKMVNMRKALRNEESPEYQEYLSAIAKTDREDLLKSLAILKRNELIRTAVRTIHQESEPETSDDPDLEEIVDVEEEKVQAEDDLLSRRQKFVDDAMVEWNTAAAEMDTEALREEALRLQTESVLAGTFNIAAGEASLFWGVFTDKKFTQKLFSNPDEVAEADPDLTKALLAKYEELENFNAETLKN